MTLRAHFGSPKDDGSERPHAWPWPCQRLLHPVWQPGDQWGRWLLWFMVYGLWVFPYATCMVYLPTKLAHKHGLNVGKYSSTMVRIWDCMVLLWHDMGWYQFNYIYILVGGFNHLEKYDFVSWDDYSHIWNGTIKNVTNHQPGYCMVLLDG